MLKEKQGNKGTKIEKKRIRETGFLGSSLL
jgi:hypothetical protein